MTIRRLKTYTGQSGYVYQYYFVGKRPALAGDPEAPSAEYIFDVSADRKTTFAVSVLLQPQALTAWAESRGRALSEPEQYAAVKLRLMQAFDEIPDMLNHGRRLRLDAELLAMLGLRSGSALKRRKESRASSKADQCGLHERPANTRRSWRRAPPHSYKRRDYERSKCEKAFADRVRTGAGRCSETLS